MLVVVVGRRIRRAADSWVIRTCVCTYMRREICSGEAAGRVIGAFPAPTGLLRLTFVPFARRISLQDVGES